MRKIVRGHAGIAKRPLTLEGETMDLFVSIKLKEIKKQ